MRAHVAQVLLDEGQRRIEAVREIERRRWLELREIDRASPVLPGGRREQALLPTTFDDMPTDDDLDEIFEESAEEAAMHIASENPPW